MDSKKGVFFFLGYNPAPSRSAIVQSIVNDHYYSPMHTQDNADHSVTLQFMQDNFNLMDGNGQETLATSRTKKRIRFQEFITERVVPQLINATSCEVDWDGELAVVELQPGDMSLFVPEAVAVEAGQRTA